jgi:hypothetical protein
MNLKTFSAMLICIMFAVSEEWLSLVILLILFVLWGGKLFLLGVNEMEERKQ